MTTTGEPLHQPRWRRLAPLLASFSGLFAGLCTLFALVVTAAEGWQEHGQAQWPETTAQVQRCGLDLYTHRPESYWINCSIIYAVHGEEVVSHVHSRTTPAPRRVIWQNPPLRFERMQEWVDKHPVGTPITVHYDPTNHRKAALVVTDMPLGEPRTPGNLRLLGLSAVSSVVLLVIARVLRSRASVSSGG